MRRLLYETVSAFGDELAERNVSAEVRSASRSSVALVRDALDALPAEGGRLGLRARQPDGALVIEVADDGEPAENGNRGGAAREIAARHRGELELRDGPERGTLASLRLPLEA